MRVVIVGAGAVGSFLAWMVVDGGGTAVLVRRGDRGRPGMPTALEVARPDGSSSSVSVDVVPGLPDAMTAGTPPDLAIVAVKQFDLRPVLEAVREIDGLPVLTVQNGVGAEEAATAALDDGRPVLAGSVTASLERSDGTIRWLRTGGLGLAVVRGGDEARRLLAELARSAGAAGVPVRGYRDHRAMKWSKLVANLVGNATSGLLDRDVAEIYADPALFAVERAQLREALAVMRAARTPVVDLPGAPVRLLAIAASLPAPLARLALRRSVASARGGKDPSLRAAVAAGGTTEVESLNGAVVRAGDALGVPTPVNAALARLVGEAAADPDRRAALRGSPDRLLEAIRRP